MTADNPNVDLVSIKSYIKFGEIRSICSQDIEWKRCFWCKSRGHNSDINVGKMISNNPNVDLFNMNAYIKFGEILSICSQDIE